MYLALAKFWLRCGTKLRTNTKSVSVRSKTQAINFYRPITRFQVYNRAIETGVRYGKNRISRSKSKSKKKTQTGPGTLHIMIHSFLSSFWLWYPISWNVAGPLDGWDGYAIAVALAFALGFAYGFLALGNGALPARLGRAPGVPVPPPVPGRSRPAAQVGPSAGGTHSCSATGTQRVQGLSCRPM